MDDAVGKLFLTVCDNEDSSIFVTGYLCINGEFHQVKLWAPDEDDNQYNSVASGAAYNGVGKDAQKAFYVTLYKPDAEKEKKYQLSATVTSVDKTSKMVAFLYVDYNCSTFFQGNVLPKTERAQSDTPAAAQGTKAKGKAKASFM